MNIEKFDDVLQVAESPTATEELVKGLLRRLKRLVIIRERCSELLNTEGMWLINQAIFATYRDCRSLGLGEESLELIRSVSSEVQERSQAAPLASV